ncbi:MAG: hypothetical protein KGL39_29530 [Patescibacteria group bacterium]|nr:hypothetical protein [Patescibacteria group bacterium]
MQGLLRAQAEGIRAKLLPMKADEAILEAALTELDRHGFDAEAPVVQKIVMSSPYHGGLGASSTGPSPWTR